MRTGYLRGFGLELVILIIIGVFVFLPVLFLNGCMSDTGEDPDNSASAIPLDDRAPVTEYTGRNNRSVIRGPQIGMLTASNNELSKPLKLTQIKANKNFLLGPAKATRAENTAGLTVRFILPIKNTTDNKAFCGIKTVGLEFKYQDEGITTDAMDQEAIGSVGIADSNSTESCLGPGEVGYFLQKIKAAYIGFLSFYGNVDEVEIEKVIVTSVSVINPNLSIAVTSYSYTDFDPTSDMLYEGAENHVLADSITGVDGPITLTFEITNTNIDPIFVWAGSSYYILLDNAGTPVYWGIINSLGVLPTQLLAGDSATLESTEMMFQGASHRMIIMMGFTVDAFTKAWDDI